MKISFSATNPCHMYPLAAAVSEHSALGQYYSGYPRWKLGNPATMDLRTHSLRTNVVYGLLKFVPEKLRPRSRSLFLWQDHGFDRWVGAHLDHCDFVHAMPGQCLETFRYAKKLGIQTVLNHATGPVREWVRIMAPEYARVGLRMEDACPYDDAYFSREEEEYALSDWHCVASTIVRDQLIAAGLDRTRIWLVPYGADDRQVYSEVQRAEPNLFRIVFAGQLALRKGIRTLLVALTLAERNNWQVDLFGAIMGEAQRDLAAYRGRVPLHLHGPVSQAALAGAFRSGSVLVLPSLEEGFGLVVPQALNCGLPAIVSDRVGAKDLIKHRHNGSIFPTQNSAALCEELTWWAAHPCRVRESLGWSEPAQTLITLSETSLS